jgi:ubiquinone/menaquinone biosynthesis C-methylase UbiE
MRYFSEEEKIQNEKWLKNYPNFLQNFYHKTKTAHDDYDEELGPLINEKTVLLDAGCGEKGIMNKYNKYKRENRLAIGVDLSLEALRKNNSLDYLLKSTVEKLPFKDGTFDVVICQWVVEHIKEPKLVFEEFKRVLKESGHLIVVTNSIYNFIMFASAILPAKIRDKMKEKVFPSEIKEGTFPTYYKCNSKNSFKKVLSGLGFSEVFSGYSGDISIFVFSKFLFILALLYEKITDLKWLNCFKMHIVVHYKKT